MGDAARIADESSDAKASPIAEFLSIDEASELLRVNRKTLTEMIRTESPPWAKPIGKIVRISRTALIKWFETEVVAPRKRRT